MQNYNACVHVPAGLLVISCTSLLLQYVNHLTCIPLGNSFTSNDGQRSARTSEVVGESMEWHVYMYMHTHTHTEREILICKYFVSINWFTLLF